MHAASTSVMEVSMTDLAALGVYAIYMGCIGVALYLDVRIRMGLRDYRR